MSHLLSTTNYHDGLYTGYNCFISWVEGQIHLFSGFISLRKRETNFLKTDWSAEGMDWILMQPADDQESQKTTARLKTTGERWFELSKHGAHLKLVAFGSWSCDDMESKYHYFTDEVAAGRFEIGKNCRFLWGCFFYWLCDCSAVKDNI